MHASSRWLERATGGFGDDEGAGHLASVSMSGAWPSKAGLVSSSVSKARYVRLHMERYVAADSLHAWRF